MKTLVYSRNPVYQKLKIEPPKKINNYLFVNNIRFWGILSVLINHACFLDASHIEPYDLSLILYQIFKFGTISMFFISGFLLGKKISSTSPQEYYKKRIKTILIPVLFFSFLHIVLNFFSAIFFSESLSVENSYSILLNKVSQLFWGSSYWFIYNYLIALGILLLFRKHLDKSATGFLFFSLTVLNTYWTYTEEDFPHTKAIFAYLFYIWLGYKASEHIDKIKMKVVKYHYFIYLSVIFFLVVSIAEMLYLNANGSLRPGSSLRISNQLFSISVGLMLLSFSQPLYPKSVEPRKHMFGLYLVTAIIQSVIYALIRPYVLHLGNFEKFIITIILVFIIFVTSLYAVKIVKQTKWAFLLGDT